MKLAELRNLDPKNVGAWPLPAKAGALLLILAAIIGLGWWVEWSVQIEELKAAEAKEEQLKTTYQEKKRMAVNLDAYKQRLAEIDRSFGTLLKQLPNKSEMDGLITDINQAGLGRGLQFELFRPAAQETVSEFYAELPVNIKVTGNYHDLGAFASDVAKMPRIVLLTDLKLDPPSPSGQLTMEAVAKTYRYLDEEEVAKQRKDSKGKKSGGKS